MKLSLIPFFFLTLAGGSFFTWLGLRSFNNPEEAQNENVDQWSNSTMKSLARIASPIWAMKLWGILAGFIVGPALLLLSVWCLVGVFFPPLGPKP